MPVTIRGAISPGEKWLSTRVGVTPPGLLRFARHDGYGLWPRADGYHHEGVMASRAAAKQSRRPLKMKQPAVYIVANQRNGTLYTGVTSDLPRRAHQHRESLVPGFAAKYGCTLLVWYERHDEMAAAIAREKQIKAGSRAKKTALIEALNPQWRDLYDELA
jgi:putative endonuclease